MENSNPQVPPVATDAPKKKYVRAVGPKLRKLLFVVFALLALLGANSGYLASITALEAYTGETYQNYFYFLMFLGHVALGLLFIVPFVVFGAIHIKNARHRRNRKAVNVGYALFAVSIIVLVTGLLLVRIEGLFDLKAPAARSTVYWMHIACPLIAGWLYWLHRLTGPKIKWKIGMVYGGVVGATIVGMVMLHSQDPRQWNVAGPKQGEEYFKPSLARTATGNFIPAEALMNDQYCLKCHPDTHAQWQDSVHHFSSFNNAAYLPSVRETRAVALKRDGNVQASRWCAGCHDPVPFFSGAFDQANYDDVNDVTAHAGITCTVCHAITHVNSTKGNADYTIEEPLHYPFAYSDNAALQWVNNQLIKAKPSFHKKTFLKPFHKTAEFCSTCHKVHLPYELNNYKEFLRGQNHYDPYLLSGVSGHGTRSFYYPPKAVDNCSKCHMPTKPSNDFGAKFFESKELSVHDHLFPGANTGIAWFREREEVIKQQQEFLNGVMRVDIFGIKEGGTIDGELHAPLRPKVPALKPGEKYLLETVIRTVKMGHLFTQGTVDSNEVWMGITVKSGDRVIGRSGGMDSEREVDPWSHFVNVFLLDKDGNRIDRRNPQDIVVPLYNHQIPPGAGQTVHYGLNLPADITEPVTVELKLNYRKFDKQYLDFMARSMKPGDKPIRGLVDGKIPNELPITVLATDTITFPIEGQGHNIENPLPKPEAWMRWNDYGIGLLLKGKAELRQAADAFSAVEELGRYDGPLNLARVLQEEGRRTEAVDAINRAAKFDNPKAPSWTMAWLSGMVNREQNRLKEAEENFRTALDDRTPEIIERGFDFSLDYKVRNLLGQTLFDRAKQVRLPDEPPTGQEALKTYNERREFREAYLKAAVDEFHKVLAVDSENLTAHFNLYQLYGLLGDKEFEEKHFNLHDRFRPDDNARGRAERLARQKYPAANYAAESVVIYKLHRPGAPGLDADSAITESGGD